jgi:hypothetical protein
MSIFCFSILNDFELYGTSSNGVGSLAPAIMSNPRATQMPSGSNSVNKDNRKVSLTPAALENEDEIIDKEERGGGEESQTGSSNSSMGSSTASMA